MTCDINEKLLIAVCDGYELRVRKALKQGANPNHVNEHGVPVVLLACDDNHWVRDRIVDLLLAAGADETPLRQAAQAVGNFNIWPSTRYVRYLAAGYEMVDRSRNITYAGSLLTCVKQ